MNDKMASRSAILVLVATFGFSYGYILEGEDPTESLVWPDEYYFKAEAIDVIKGSNIPFEIWYSLENNRSRIDYYGGMVKKYYYAVNETGTGTMYMVHPETTEVETNQMKCYELEQNYVALDFLPYVDSYVYVGNIKLDGKDVQTWQMVEETEQVRFEDTLYVYRTEGGADVPIEHINKLYDLWNGELKDHVIFNYFNYKPSVDLDKLDVFQGEDVNCIHIDTLGKDLHTDLKYLHPDISIDLDPGFESYKNHYNRKYHDTEHRIRRSFFRKNWRRVVHHNRQNLGYKLTLNQFADRTDNELRYLTGTFPSNPQELGTVPFPHTDEELEAMVEQLPKEFDLRIEGVLTPVKDQADCGSCWAFTTIAAVEGVVGRNYGRVVDLSEQSLIDCSWGFENMGCDGGFLDGALKYILKHGIPMESEYGTYLQKDGYCHMDNMTNNYKIRGFSKVTPNSVSALKVAVYKYGPVAVTIHASDDMLLYSNGVFYDQECEGKGINHGVTVVGYGVRDGTEYWIVKNSWSESWGEDGYILMSAANNNCNLTSTPYYPVV